MCDAMVYAKNFRECSGEQNDVTGIMYRGGERMK